MKLGSVTITRTRRPRVRRETPRMVVIVALTSVVVIGLHELFYHRFVPTAQQEYPFYGVLSHPASDMIILALVTVLAVVVESHRTDGDDE